MLEYLISQKIDISDLAQEELNSLGYSFQPIDSTELNTTKKSDSGESNKNSAQIPDRFALHQNYPNPFNPTTEIRYDLPEYSHVIISIFNIRGQKVRILTNRPIIAGYHSVIWDGKDEYGNEVGSGIYIYHFYAEPDKNDSKPYKSIMKMTLLR